jgi:hypothetical protein
METDRNLRGENIIRGRLRKEFGNNKGQQKDGENSILKDM